MTSNSNAVWERQAEVLPAPKPPSCTIALPNGLSIPLLALHDVQLPQPPPPHDPTCTFHIYPHLPSNCRFCRGVDDYLGCSMDSTSLPVAASPSQSGSSVPEDDCSPLTLVDRSSSFSPVPLRSSPPRTSKAKGKSKASPKDGVVPAHMMSVLRTGTHSERSSSRRVRGPATQPRSSTTTLEPSLAHRTSPSSRRDPRCKFPLPPDSDWVRHWRRSCRDNPDRRYFCPKGCGLEFTRKDNAKRHVSEGLCPRQGGSGNTLQPSRAISTPSAGSTISPGFGFFSSSP